MTKLAEGKMYVSRDGRTVGPMEAVCIIDSRDGYPVRRFRDHQARYTRLAWHPNGKFIEGCVSKLDLVRSARTKDPR